MPTTNVLFHTGRYSAYRPIKPTYEGVLTEIDIYRAIRDLKAEGYHLKAIIFSLKSYNIVRDHVRRLQELPQDIHLTQYFGLPVALHPNKNEGKYISFA